MITKGIALGSVVDIVFYPLVKNEKIFFLVLVSQLIGPVGCDERFLTII
jgi:hypothetical protein